MNQPKLLHSLNVEFGRNVTVVEPVNLYECKIGDDCLGPFVEIQRNVIIGKDVKFNPMFLFVSL